MSAGTKRLLTDATVAIDRAEHVALVGPNGSGKTTLLETLLGRQLGYGVVPAYFSQQETELDERGTVLDCVQSMTGLTRPNAQNLLGRFLFSGWEEHQKAVSVLSGGERRRLALAAVVASGANFLVLDEPTNHLDLESREALEDALRAFPGTVLLVSHDRALLDAVAERTLAIEDLRLESYDGGWADYVRRREERAAAEQAASEGRDPGTVRKEPRPRRTAPAKPRSRSGRASCSSSRPRSRRRSGRSPTSSAASPTTGRTSTRLPRTAVHARSWRRCSRAGKRSSSRLRRSSARGRASRAPSRR